MWHASSGLTCHPTSCQPVCVLGVLAATLTTGRKMIAFLLPLHSQIIFFQGHSPCLCGCQTAPRGMKAQTRSAHPHPLYHVSPWHPSEPQLSQMPLGTQQLCTKQVPPRQMSFPCELGCMNFADTRDAGISHSTLSRRGKTEPLGKQSYALVETQAAAQHRWAQWDKHVGQGTAPVKVHTHAPGPPCAMRAQ